MEDKEINRVDDEIDLRESFGVLIKRKKLIISLFLGAVFLTAAIGLLLPRSWEVFIQVTPPVALGSEGEIHYLDSPETIKSVVEEGVFNTEIVRELGLDPAERDEYLEFEATIPGEAKILKIALKENRENLGLAKNILNQLVLSLGRYYQDIIEVRTRRIESQMEVAANGIEDIKKNKIGKLKSAIILNKQRIAILDEREAHLLKEIEKSASNVEQVVAQRDSLVGREASDFSSLLDTTLIHQIISHNNHLMSELSNLRERRESRSSEIKNLTHEVRSAEIDIKNLEIDLGNLRYEKGNIRNLRLLAGGEPWVSSRPVSRGLKLKLAVVGLLALMLGVFLAFFMEFLQKPAERGNK